MGDGGGGGGVAGSQALSPRYESLSGKIGTSHTVDGVESPAVGAGCSVSVMERTKIGV